MNKPRDNVLTVGISRDESRNKRETQTLSLRKREREERLSKRRYQNTDSENSISLEDITILSQQLFSNDTDDVINATKSFRIMLSKVVNPPINDVINLGIVPRLIEALGSENETLQYESLWCLTNIASGSHENTEYLVLLDVIPTIMMFLKSPNHKVREQACWVIGNIAGDQVPFRDYVLQNGGMDHILNLLETENKTNVIKIATWTMSNLCRGSPLPPFDDVKEAVPVASRLIFSKVKDIVVDALWTLSFLSEGKDKKQSAVVECNVCVQLNEFLNEDDLSFVVPSLRTIGNLLSGNNATTQKVIDANVMESLKSLLNHEKMGIRKETCWCISNILAGTPEQIQCVIDSDIIMVILNLIFNDRFDIKKEAGWCVANAISGSTPGQIYYFACHGCVHILCTLLSFKDIQLLNMTLDALDRTLKFGKKFQLEKKTDGNIFGKIVEECGGLEILEAIHRSQNNNVIYEKVQKILNNYFIVNKEEPQINANQDSYEFNVGENNTSYQL